MTITHDERREGAEPPKPSPSEGRWLVAAIAASAESLPALTTLLAAIPADERLSLIIAQRFGGEGGELHPERLAAAARRPVTPMADGAPILPGHVYVTPAQALVGVVKGRFRIRPPRHGGERRATVDALFRALARDFGPRAVGILLAREGSDGAIGVQTIAAAGGMTMAQATGDPATPPGETGGAGFVDHVLPPEDMGRALVNYLDFWSASESGDGPRQRRRSIQERLFEICAFLREQTGVDFKHYRTTTLLRRIERRMQVLRLSSVDAYVERISQEAAEAHALFRELLIGVTAFFRDPEAFAALAESALAPLLASRSQADSVRIWIPASATGEEAYSIAILMRELMDKMESPPRVQIFATDLNERALTVGRRGHYPQGIAASLSAERLARFFVKRGRRYHVVPELREMVLFSVHNVIADPPFSQLDLISCRNLIIYLGAHLQKKLIPLFHYALRGGGYLFLGSSETLAGHGELFRDINGRHRLAQRKDAALRAPGRIDEPSGAGQLGSKDVALQPATDLGAVAQRIILDEFAPRYAIVNEEAQVVFLSEGVERYIHTHPGTFTSNVMRMARRGLSVGLRTAFGEALRHRRTATTEITMRGSEGPEQVRLTVQPMPELGMEEGLYMLVFHSLGAPPLSARAEPAGTQPDADAVIAHLEQELLRAREDLDRAVQDLEAANEELKSSNEELLSMNEELQSANEELETSKEDVQSANEALWAANADLDNHLRSMRIATIFLDAQGAIRGFTPAASGIYHLVPGDVGRPLAHFNHVLVDPPPLPDLEKVSGSAEPIEAELRASDGRWLTRRILPYRDRAGAVDGLVVTFLDVTRRKRDEEELRRTTVLLQAVGEATDDLIYVKDREGRLLFANPATLRLIGKTAAETIGRRVEDWYDAPRGARDAAAHDRSVVDSGVGAVVEEAVTGPAAQGTRYFSVSKKPLLGPSGGVIGMLAVAGDVTEYRRLLGERDGLLGKVEEERARLAESERNYRVLFEQAAVGIEQATLDGRVITVNDQLCAMLGYSRDELLSKTFVDITDPADLPRERRRHKRLYAGTIDSYVFEKRYVRRNGTRLWARVTSSLARDDEGKVLYRMSIIEDISERRRAQQELRESEARYRATFEQAAIGIAHVGLDGQWIAVNDRLCAITGYPREEMLRSRFQDITHPDDLDADLSALAELLSGARQIMAIEKRYLRKNGSVVWVNVTSALVRRDDGEPAYLITVVEDITDDLRAALTDARLAAIVRSSQDAIFSFDHDGVIGSWNSSAERLFGYRAEEIIGQQRSLLLPDSLVREGADVIENLSDEETVVSMESQRKRKDGTVFPCVVSISQIHASSGKLLGFSSTVRDITDRRQWEERQKLMARELVHRVKNSFAVIQSIVRQTQRSTPDPAAFALAFSGRLAAMAASHDLLTDRHWEGAGLRDLVASQLAPFAAGAEKRVRVSGPEVLLDTSLAVPLGLALHELATNATKYGSLSKPGGIVDLSWTVSSTGGNEQLSLVWRESGGPPVSAPARRGFGTSLIERGLPDARIERRFDPEGLVCRIELPTSGVRADTAEH